MCWYRLSHCQLWRGVTEVTGSVIVAVSLIGIVYRRAVVDVATDAVGVDVIVGIKWKGIVAVRDAVVVRINSRSVTRVTRLAIKELPTLIVITEVTPVYKIVSLCMRIENKLSVTGTGKDNNSGAFINHSELLSVTVVAVLLLNARTVRG